MQPAPRLSTLYPKGSPASRRGAAFLFPFSPHFNHPCGGSGHLLGKFAVPLALAARRDPLLQFRPVLILPRLKHAPHFRRAARLILVFKDDIAHIKARGLLALPLEFRRNAVNRHAHRHDVGRKAENAARSAR